MNSFLKLVQFTRVLGWQYFNVPYNVYQEPEMIKMSTIQGQISAEPLRLIGFVKAFNEEETGNLERCLKHMKTFCDDIVVCDDSSTDRTIDVARRYTSHIIVLPNNFRRELEHKQRILEKALQLEPDWIVWLDPDETFDRIGEEGGIRQLCSYGSRKGIDSFSFLYYNLWKSNKYYRVDDLWLSNWQIKLWKNTGRLRFRIKAGLHQELSPLGLMNYAKTNIKVIHYGFSSPELIKRKYDTYRTLGQYGRDLERLIDESSLRTEALDSETFPISIAAADTASSARRHSCKQGVTAQA